MIIRKLFLAVLVCASFPAAAEFTTRELAIEVSLADMQVPATANGSLTFKQCGDCDYRSIPMSRDTRFVVNGKDVGLKAFRRSVLSVRDRDSETIIVMHHLESNTITTVSASI